MPSTFAMLDSYPNIPMYIYIYIYIYIYMFTVNLVPKMTISEQRLLTVTVHLCASNNS